MVLIPQILFMEASRVKKHIVNIVQSMVFLIILVISLYYINQVLMPKTTLKNSLWPTTSTYEQFYNMKENSIDVLFLGSSVVVNAFSPQEIYNNYGIRSYNLGSEQQSIFLSYFWLKEALRFQSPKVVVLDTRFLFELHPENPVNTAEGIARKSLDPMKWSPVKREAISELCAIDKEQSELSYYLTNLRFHSRWSELSELDILSNEYKDSPLKGFGPIATYGPDTYNTFTSNGDTQSQAATHKIMQIYMDKLTYLCEENGIALVLISLPGNSMNDSINNTLTAYAKQKGVDYYNFCETKTYNAVGATLPRENIIFHGNIWGAMKMSQYVGKMLRDTYSVAAVHDNQYEKTRDYYEHIINVCELTHITDINEYLQAIDDEQYTIFIVAREEATRGLTEQAIENLRALGLQQDLTGKYQWSYNAVVSPENGVSEVLKEKQQVYMTGSIRNNQSIYALLSGGYLSGTGSSIVIDGVEYCKNKRGLNFVIYDNCLMKVVDQVTFDTFGTCEAIR